VGSSLLVEKSNSGNVPGNSKVYKKILPEADVRSDGRPADEISCSSKSVIGAKTSKVTFMDDKAFVIEISSRKSFPFSVSKTISYFT